MSRLDRLNTSHAIDKTWIITNRECLPFKALMKSLNDSRVTASQVRIYNRHLALTGNGKPERLRGWTTRKSTQSHLLLMPELLNLRLMFYDVSRLSPRMCWRLKPVKGCSALPQQTIGSKAMIQTRHSRVTLYRADLVSQYESASILLSTADARLQLHTRTSIHHVLFLWASLQLRSLSQVLLSTKRPLNRLELRLAAFMVAIRRHVWNEMDSVGFRV